MILLMGEDSTKIIYPYMPEGRSILYVPKENPFMIEAEKAWREMSTDLNHPTGAVIVKDGQIIGRGANHSVFSYKPFVRLHAAGVCVRKFFKVKSGQKYWLCPGCVTNKNHAESSAIRDAVSKHGAEAVKGADLYLHGHWWCCKPCWDSMIAAGIINVYLLEGSEKLFK